MNFNTNYNSPQFTAVTIKPHPSKWNKDILNSALNSTAIKEKILTNEKAGEDTILEYTSNILQHAPNNMLFTDMSFTVKGNNSRLHLKAENVSAFVPFVMGDSIFIAKGPENLGKNIAKQIDSLSEKNDTKSIEEGLQGLKGIASDVIYEPIPDAKPIKNTAKKGFFGRLFG
ncbi:MAG: hypothetical protein NC200_00215 [Candidatus Gastranaerophilales bacterium]|nr:hypothetical protein [Candidatus Gastranaerophilales bacterium]